MLISKQLFHSAAIKAQYSFHTPLQCVVVQQPSVIFVYNKFIKSDSHLIRVVRHQYTII